MIINSSVVNSIFNNNDFKNVMFGLSYRWSDECNYEDIKEYAIPIRKLLDKLVPNNGWSQNIKMTKRPFGFKVILPYTYANGITKESILIFIASVSGKYEWKVQPA